MKKLLTLLTLMLMLPMVTFAQVQEKKPQTTFEKFTSSLGTMMKFVDYDLPDIKSKYAVANSSIRKVITNNETECFLNISFTNARNEEYSAYIAYNDVIELKKALDELKKQVVNDGTGDANYLENTFTTKDNLKMGYYIEKKKSTDKAPTWVLNLEGFGSSSLIFDDSSALSTLFDNAIQKLNAVK